MKKQAKKVVKVEAEAKLERPVKKVKFFRRLDCLKHNPNNGPFLRAAWEEGATICTFCDKYYLKGKEIPAESIER